MKVSVDNGICFFAPIAGYYEKYLCLWKCMPRLRKIRGNPWQPNKRLCVLFVAHSYRGLWFSNIRTDRGSCGIEELRHVKLTRYCWVGVVASAVVYRGQVCLCTADLGLPPSSTFPQADVYTQGSKAQKVFKLKGSVFTYLHKMLATISKMGYCCKLYIHHRYIYMNLIHTPWLCIHINWSIIVTFVVGLMITDDLVW